MNNHTQLEAAFHPNAIAVVGASDDPVSAGGQFLRYLREYGYSGKLFPVNPKRPVISGLKAYPSVSTIPEPIDYVICCIPARGIPSLLDECAGQGVKVVHIFSGRLSETGNQKAKLLEEHILQKARSLNIRLIGPNCMGIYHPKQGMAFSDDLPKEPGEIGGLFQSGGLPILLAREGGLRGLKFSKVVSYGNGLDLDECDFLEYLTQDEETKIIACYIEGVRDGKRFLRTLRRTTSTKPVIMIKGGQGIAGTKATLSHTASLSGSHTTWQALMQQTGAIQVEDLNELINLLIAFSFFRPVKGKRVAIFGGGGGISVLTADAGERAGLSVPPLPSDIREKLEAEAPELPGWLGNPVDASVAVPLLGLDKGPEKTLQMLAESPQFDFIIFTLDESAGLPKQERLALIERQVEAIITLSQTQSKPMVVLLNHGTITPEQLQDRRWGLLANLRSRLITARIPVYSHTDEAAKAVSMLIDFYHKKGEQAS